MIWMRLVLALLVALCFAPATSWASTGTSCKNGVQNSSDSAFAQLIRNVPENERHFLVSHASEAHVIEALRRDLAVGNWEWTGLDRKCADCYRPVLRAAFTLAQKGEISVDLFASIVILWEMVSDIPHRLDEALVAMPILKEGRLTPEAESAFVRPGLLYDILQDTERKNQAATIGAFEAAVARLPKAEQVFWKFYYPLRFVAPSSRRGGSVYEPPPFGAAMDDLLFYNSALSGYKSLDSRTNLPAHERYYEITVPSIGALRALQTAGFGDAAVQPIPQLGIVDKSEILTQVAQHKRVLGLKFPYLSGLEFADGRRCANFAYTLHDLYHLVYGSFSPRGYRQALASFATELPRLLAAEQSVVIKGKEYFFSAMAAPQLDDLTTDIINFDIAQRTRASATDVFKTAFRTSIISLNVAGRNVLFSSRGLQYFVLDIARRPAHYQSMLGEPPMAVLQQLDSALPPESISYVELYNALSQTTSDAQ